MRDFDVPNRTPEGPVFPSRLATLAPYAVSRQSVGRLGAHIFSFALQNIAGNTKRQRTKEQHSISIITTLLVIGGLIVDK